MRAPLALLVVVVAVTAGAACAGEVNCENLCLHTLACEVTFAPADDIDGAKIESGERTDDEGCALGCAENPAVTVDSALCVDNVTAADTNPATCQGPVLECFGAKVADAS